MVHQDEGTDLMVGGGGYITRLVILIGGWYIRMR